MRTHLAKHRVTFKAAPIIAFIGLQTAGCELAEVMSSDEATETSAELKIGDVVPLAVPEDWIGHELGLAHPLLRVVRKDAVPNGNDSSSAVPLDTSNPVPDRPAVPDNRMMARGPDGTVYEVLIPANDLSRLRNRLAPGSRAAASQQTDFAEDPSLEQKSWSNSADTRSIITNPVASYPRRTIGVLSPNANDWGTAVLIEEKLIMTVLHAFYNGAGTWTGAKFRAAQSGSTKPYGEVAVTWVFYDSGFESNSCHVAWQAQCTKWDWAIGLLASWPVNSSGIGAGYMGFEFSTSDPYLTGLVPKRLYGYPDCGSAGAPAGCSGDNRMYGQDNCSIGAYNYAVDGLYRSMAFGCDASAGQSGAPLYYTASDGFPYALGALSAESINCYSNCPWNNPNFAYRLAAWWYDSMVYYRSIY